MRKSRIRERLVFASTLAALLFVWAPAAAAQYLLPLVIRPIGYRVSLPGPGAGWTMPTTEKDMVTAGRRDAVIIVSATDLAALQGNPGSASTEDQRRILTERFMGSDSVMMALMTRVLPRVGATEPERLALEVRTVGGQRAAYIRDRPVQDGEARWRQAYITVKDGIMYLLVFVVQGSDPDAHQGIFDRVLQSFVPAGVPPS